MKNSAFGNEGRFWKGNIHTHTEVSDGKLPVSEVVDIYSKLGYDFLAITDHNRVFKSREFNDRLYIVPALEIHSSKPSGFKVHHMVALTTYDNDLVEHGQLIENAVWDTPKTSAVAITDMMNAKGFDMVYCHPVWSRVDPIEYMDANFMAMEVYNGICELKYNHGNAEQHWDYMLRRGKRIMGVAADDCHGGEGHNGRGFLMVKSESLDDKSLISAIKAGNYYSSRGPLIHDFYIEDGVAVVKCSPALRITFITYEYLGGSQIFDEPVTEYSIRFNPNIDYIRVEVEDENGLKAWTNPIFLR